MSVARYDDLRKRERPVDLNDIAELRQVILNLATAVAGALAMMREDAAPGASLSRLEDLENLYGFALDCCHRLEPDHPLA
jgi:hypothetical protein